MNAPALQLVPTGPTRDHASYIGGSDIGAVVGVGYRTALDVWAEKTGRLKFDGNDRTEFGNHFERPILQLYSKRNGVIELEYPGTISHPTIPHLAATPDALVDRLRAVQVKCVGRNAASMWGDPLDGPDGVPPDVVLQVTLETGLARRVHNIKGEVAHVVAMLGTELPTYEIPFDQQLFENLETIADEFWRKHVEADVMPEVTAEDVATLRKMYAAPPAGTPLLIATDEVKALARAYAGARDSGSKAQSFKEHLGAQLIALIADGPGFVSPVEGIKVSYPLKQGSVSWKGVAADYRRQAVRAGVPESLLDAIVEQHTSEATRALDVRVKGQ